MTLRKGTCVPPVLGSAPHSAHGALPQGLADHVLIGDAVVGECLLPGGVQSVPQRFGSQLIRLENKGDGGQQDPAPGSPWSIDGQ